MLDKEEKQIKESDKLFKEFSKTILEEQGQSYDDLSHAMYLSYLYCSSKQQLELLEYFAKTKADSKQLDTLISKLKEELKAQRKSMVEEGLLK